MTLAEHLYHTITGLPTEDFIELRYMLQTQAGMDLGVPCTIDNKQPAQETYDVVITACHGNRVALVKALRHLLPSQSLKESVEIVRGIQEGLWCHPHTIARGVIRAHAWSLADRLNASGFTAEVYPSYDIPKQSDASSLQDGK